MSHPGPTALAVVVPTPLLLGDAEVLILALLALTLTAFFAVLRSGLLHSVPSRILEDADDDAARSALRPLLERAEALATSASVLQITCEIFFVVLVLGLIGDQLSPATMGFALLVSVPLLVFATEFVPSMLRGDRSDRLIRATLGTFELLQRPLAALIYFLHALKRAVMRVLGIPERPTSARRIVEDLRDVIEESEREGELQESEREMIENVVEFYDVDVADVMTPRTEVTAVEIDDDIDVLVRAIAESGHGRIPVYEKTLDTIIGLAYAQDVLELVAKNAHEDESLRSLLQPVGFVPESKLVSELLTEFRIGKRKMAVVLDEYGGTAGIVTLADIIAELVGDVREEHGEPAPEPIRVRGDGTVEIQGTTRIDEVNEELELGLPEEEDFETIAGFVLSRMGAFPKPGESFDWEGLHFTTTKANDRRVFEVLLERPTAHKLA